jgi:archaemetzincin
MEANKKFRVPDDKARKFALGKFGDATNSKKLFKALEQFFQPIPEPKTGDWLDKHTELGQTFYEFKMSTRPEKTIDNDTIYIVPLEENMDPDLIEIIYYFTLAYYHSMKVKMLPPLDIRKAKITTRIYKGHYQYNATEVLKFLQKKLPSDGFCIVGIMMTDLYPKEGKNFGTEALRLLNYSKRTCFATGQMWSLFFYPKRRQLFRRETKIDEEFRPDHLQILQGTAI